MNLLLKLMQIYNCDETGVTIVFKPGMQTCVFSLCSREGKNPYSFVMYFCKWFFSATNDGIPS